MNLQLVVAISFIVLAISINLIVISYRNKKQRKVFQEFADKYSLKFSTSRFLLKQYPNIEGTFLGYHLKIKEESKGGLTEGDKKRYTVAYLETPKSDLNFSISRENIYKKLSKLFQDEQINIGIEEIDKKLYFQSNNPPLFKSILNYQIEDKLLDSKFKGSIICQNSQMKCIQFKSISSKSKMEGFEELLDICVLFANEIKKNEHE